MCGYTHAHTEGVSPQLPSIVLFKYWTVKENWMLNKMLKDFKIIRYNRSTNLILLKWRIKGPLQKCFPLMLLSIYVLSSRLIKRFRVGIEFIKINGKALVLFYNENIKCLFSSAVVQVGMMVPSDVWCKSMVLNKNQSSKWYELLQLVCNRQRIQIKLGGKLTTFLSQDYALKNWSQTRGRSASSFQCN